MSAVGRPRVPCERCGARLYYHEQRQTHCRACAAALGIERLCDRGRTRITAAEIDAARGLLAQALRGGAPRKVIETWERWIASAASATDSVGSESALEARAREQGGSAR